MRVVITGPTGTLGMALIEKCRENAIEVLAICHRSSKRTENIREDELVKVLFCDLDEYKDIVADNVCGKYDIFFHLAWNGANGAGREDVKLQTENVMHAIKAVELARKLGCHTFVGAGSQAEYGRTEEILKPDTPAFPETGYGIAKLCAGQMTRIKCGQLGLKHIWLRILSVYGPYDGENTMIISIIRKMLAGEMVACTKGEQQWDYLYCDDAARAMLKLGIKGRDGSIYCLGSGKTRSIRAYIETMKDSIQSDSVIEYGALPYSEKQVMYLKADISDLQKEIGFCAETEFETGILETIKWCKNHRNKQA